MAVQVLGKVAYFNKGAYNSQTNYEINDVVSYNGSSYVSLNDNNQGNLPTNTNYWSVVAEKGDKGDTGKPFVIEKTYSTIESMVADYDNMNVNDYVMIQGSIEEQENATLWTKREVEVSPYKWAYLADFSGASGITGATPNIHIGNVTEGNEPSVTRRSGSSNENPILDFVLKTGAKGDTGATGNGISSFEKTSTSSLVDTYTITFTNGTSTTIEVTNGRGIVSIVKTGTVDYVDTYTITYNDGTTSTFEVANSEVTEEEFNDVVDELNYLYDDLPKVEGEGTNLTLNNTRKGKMSNVLRGNINQESTTGKNLCPIDNSNFTATSTWSSLRGTNANTYTDGTKVHLTAGTYTISFSDYSNLDAIQVFVGGYTVVSTITGTFTLDTEGDIYIRVKAGNNTSPIKFKTQLEIGTTVTDWEKYTGGQPSPNPDYPQDVHVVSGNNTIVVEGKNLFDKDNSTFDEYLLETGETAVDQAWIITPYIKVDSGANYTYQGITRAGNAPYSCYYDSSKTFVSSFKQATGTNTITIPSGVSYVRFSIMNRDANLDINTFMIEKGLTASPYTPYVSQSYQISLEDIELCKIGDYQDYIYKDNGKWYKHSEIGKQILDGTEAWVYSVVNLVFYSDVLQSPPVVKNSSRFYCNRFNYVSWNTSFENMLNGQGRYQADGNHRIIFKHYDYTTSNDFKNWLSTNNTIVYYVLATPTNTEITDQTLIAQLDNFEKAISYNTQTNISQENNDLPFIISASAFMSLKYIFGNLETRVAELEG